MRKIGNRVNHPLNKSEALKLVQVFGNAAIQSYQFCNGLVKDRNAIHKEHTAARKLLEQLTDEPVTGEEINQILGG